MNVTDSSEHGNPREFVFIIGAPRSGTTWLHLMMGAHPEIATGQESQLFEGYLSAFARRWQEELDWPESEEVRKHGISSYLTDEEFTALLRHVAIRVLSRVADEKPNATHILEKSPNNAFHTALIHRCLPEVRFIHVVRDGRDVATSMMKASQGWGRSWAPARVDDAAASWVRSVREAQSTRAFTERYVEVRYEALLNDGVSELLRMFDFAGVSASPEQARRIYDDFSFEKVKSGAYQRSVFASPGVSAASGTEARQEPPDFFRKGVAGDWQQSLSESQLRSFNWVAGELLAELGYATAESTFVKREPASLRWRSFRHKLRRRLASAGRSILGG